MSSSMMTPKSLRVGDDCIETRVREVNEKELVSFEVQVAVDENRYDFLFFSRCEGD